MNDIAVIHLANGGFAIVDSDIAASVADRDWRRASNGYARRQHREGRKVVTEWLHRVINGTPPDTLTDHRNGNKLDNRRTNLRNATKSKNMANSVKLRRRRLTSHFKGVSFHGSTGLWRARLTIGKREICAYFQTQEDAAYAYNELAIKYFGDFAKLNEVPNG